MKQNMTQQEKIDYIAKSWKLSSSEKTDVKPTKDSNVFEQDWSDFAYRLNEENGNILRFWKGRDK
jgi:predicted adenine nucleotide alpha hydrolase (AANH) superfamily ATPase